MRTNLSLIQPKEYNKLFSSYHNDSKISKFTNYNLPKLSKLFPFKEKQEQTSGTFSNKNFNIKLEKPKVVSYYENKKQKIIYPLLNVSFNNESSYKDNERENIDIIPATMYHSYKINNEKPNKLSKVQKNKSRQLNMVYLNLVKIPPQKQKSIQLLNLDSFYNGLDNFEFKNKNNNEILSEKINEINKKSIIKLNNIFNNIDYEKLNNDFTKFHTISKDIINKSIEKILTGKRLNRNFNKTENNLFNEIDGERTILVNNVFFDWILDNVRHKVELTNEYNEVLSTVWVRNLIYKEMTELKNRFAEFRKLINLPNFIHQLEMQRINNILNKKKSLRNDKSNLTSSTLKSYYNNSNLRSYANSSNINSYYNSSYDNDKRHQINIFQNTTTDGSTVGFDFFDSNNIKKDQKVFNYTDKEIISVNTPSISNFHFMNKIKKDRKSFIRARYKDELNNNINKININGEEELWFKNVYLNNPRSHKVKNFRTNYEVPHSRIDSFNDKYLYFRDKIQQEKKNSDIINVKESIQNKSSIQNNNNNNNYYNYINNSKKNIPLKTAYSLNISIKDNNFNSIQEELNNKIGKKNGITPSKKIVLKEGEDLWIKPKFKNIIKNMQEKAKNGKINEEEIYDVNNYFKKDNKDSKNNKNYKEDKDNNYNNNNFSKDNKQYNNQKNNNYKKNGNDKYDDGKNNDNNNNSYKNNYKNEEKNYSNKKNNEDNQRNKSIRDSDKKLDDNNIINDKLSRKNSTKKDKEKKAKENPYSYFELNDDKDKEYEDDDDNMKKSKRKSVFYFPNALSSKNKKGNEDNKKNNNMATDNKTNKKRYDLSSSSSNSSNNREEQRDAYNDMIKNELANDMKKNMIFKKGNSNKAKGTLFKYNKLQKRKSRSSFLKFNKEQNTSLYSLDSANEEEQKEEIEEIKYEINILSSLLNEKEANNLFNQVVKFAKYLRKRDKTEENRKQIQIKRLEINSIIQKYFEILLYENLTIKEIKEEKLHIEIHKQLKMLEKFGLYPIEELLDLEEACVEDRKEELEDYLKGGENYDKKWKKSKTFKNSFHRFDSTGSYRTKYDKSSGEIHKRHTLIYNNLYLFKDKGDSDDEKTDKMIKKEIQDILNTDYGNISNDTERAKNAPFLEKRRKYINEVKKKFVKIKGKDNNLIQLKDELLNEDILKSLRKESMIIDDKLKEEEIRDKRIYQFFAQIQKLKKRQYKNNEEEINSFIDHQIENNNDILKEKDDGRLNFFLQEFNLNRIRAKFAFNSKYKRIGYISPIIFTSRNDNFNMSQANKFDGNKK